MYCRWTQRSAEGTLSDSNPPSTHPRPSRRDLPELSKQTVPDDVVESLSLSELDRVLANLKTASNGSCLTFSSGTSGNATTSCCFGPLFRCSRRSTLQWTIKVSYGSEKTNSKPTYVSPPKPIEVKKLIANLVSRGLSLGKTPSKACCMVLQWKGFGFLWEYKDCQAVLMIQSQGPSQVDHWQTWVLTDLGFFRTTSPNPWIRPVLETGSLCRSYSPT